MLCNICWPHDHWKTWTRIFCLFHRVPLTPILRPHQDLKICRSSSSLLPLISLQHRIVFASPIWPTLYRELFIGHELQNVLPATGHWRILSVFVDPFQKVFPICTSARTSLHTQAHACAITSVTDSLVNVQAWLSALLQVMVLKNLPTHSRRNIPIKVHVRVRLETMRRTVHIINYVGNMKRGESSSQTKKLPFISFSGIAIVEFYPTTWLISRKLRSLTITKVQLSDELLTHFFQNSSC